MIPKSRRDILNVCYDNFSNYSTLTKILIIASVVLSAISVALYICEYIYPTGYGIINGDITGWHIVWKICFAFILYIVLQTVNLVFVSISGAAVCNEENWEIDDFAKAWLNMYKYEQDAGDKNFEN